MAKIAYRVLTTRHVSTSRAIFPSRALSFHSAISERKEGLSCSLQNLFSVQNSKIATSRTSLHPRLFSHCWPIKETLETRYGKWYSMFEMLCCVELNLILDHTQFLIWWLLGFNPVMDCNLIWKRNRLKRSLSLMLLFWDQVTENEAFLPWTRLVIMGR